MNLAELDALEAKIVWAKNQVVGSDLDGVEILHKMDDVRREAAAHVPALIDMARERFKLPEPADYCVPYKLSTEAMLYDFKVPAFVRAFIAIRSLNAVCTSAIDDAGYMPRLYAKYQGKPVQVSMVSRLGDVGIAPDNRRHGYNQRLSIYELTDFTQENPFG